MGKGELAQAVELLYEAAVDPAVWEKALQAVGTAAGGADVCRLTGWDREQNAPALVVRQTSSLAGATLQRHEELYFAHYRSLDLRLEHAEAHLRGRIGSCDAYLSESQVRRSEFYQDFMRREGDVRWTVGGRVYEAGSVYVDFALERVRDRGAFSQQEVDRIESLAPHFERAIATCMRLRDARLSEARSATALDALDCGVVVLGAAARVLGLNRRAEAILRDSGALRVSQGCLSVSSSTPTCRLDQTVDRVLDSGVSASLRVVGEPPAGGKEITVTLVRPARTDQYVAHHLGGRVQPHVVALLTAAECRRATAKQLMELYGFTAAEARVARSIVSGHSLEETAEEFGVSLCTVKTQLRAVLGKAGCKNQAALCTRLASLPSAR